MERIPSPNNWQARLRQAAVLLMLGLGLNPSQADAQAPAGRQSAPPVPTAPALPPEDHTIQGDSLHHYQPQSEAPEQVQREIEEYKREAVKRLLRLLFDQYKKSSPHGGRDPFFEFQNITLDPWLKSLRPQDLERLELELQHLQQEIEMDWEALNQLLKSLGIEVYRHPQEKPLA